MSFLFNRKDNLEKKLNKFNKNIVNTIVANKEDNKKKLTQKDKKLHKNIIIIISIISTILWLLLVIYIYNNIKIYKIENIFVYVIIGTLFILPFLAILYNAYNHFSLIELSKTIADERDKINEKIIDNSKISDTIISIVFGIALLFNSRYLNEKMASKYIKFLLPYLVIALIFGSIIPYIVEHIVSENMKVRELLILENVEYIFEAFAIVILLITIVPIL